MKLLSYLTGSLAVFSGFAVPLRAVIQNAGDAVYATWNGGSGLIGNAGVSIGDANECGPGEFEVEITLSGGVVGQTYYFEAGVDGGLFHYIDSWQNLSYQAASVSFGGVDVHQVPATSYWTIDDWPNQPVHVERTLPVQFRGTRRIAFKGGTTQTVKAKYVNTGPDSLWGPWTDTVRLWMKPTTGCGNEDPNGPGPEPAPCASCKDSKTAARGSGGNDSIRVSIDLGPDRFDGLSGSLGFHVLDDRHGADLYSPNLLAVSGISETVDSTFTPPSALAAIYRVLDSGGTVDKIISPGSFIDVVPLSSPRVGYELRFYHLSQANFSTWALLSGQTPHTTWLFEDINLTGGTQLYVIKKPAGSNRWTVYNYRFSRTVLDDHLTEQGWSLEVYDAQQTSGNAYSVVQTLSRSEVIDTFEQDDVDDGLREAFKIKTAKKTWTDLGTAVESTGGMLIESWEKEYTVVADQYVVAEHRVGVGSADEKATTYTYTVVDDRPVVQHRVDSDGRWMHVISHDESGRPTLWVEQYQNNAYNASDPAAQNREFYITSYGPDLETTTEKLAGTVVSKRWLKLEDWGTEIPGDNNYRKITEAVATEVNASDWDDDTNLATVTYLYDEEVPSSGQRLNAPWLVIRPDGQATLKKYYYDTATVNGATVPTELVETYQGVPSTTVPSDYTATITAGTKTVEERTYDGQLVYRKVTDIGSSVVLEERLAVDFDAFGRVTEYKLFNNNALTEKRSYACCGLEWETDAYGVKTEYTYDALGRLETRTDYANGTGDQPPVRREYVHDALNRRTMTLIGPYSLAIEEEVLTYNLAGELIQRDDGYPYRTTTYAEAKVGDYMVHTTTAPDGSTQVEKRYQDGSLYEKVLTVSPTATRGMRYAYASDSSGNRSVTETPLDNGTAVTAAAVVRWTDFAGRSWKTVSPDPDESGTVEEVRHYATPSQTSYKLGQLYKIARTGRPDTLFTYDSLGRLSAQGEDINADGVLTASGGTDRLREFIHTYGSHSGTGYHTLTTRIWNASGSYLTDTEGKAFSPYPFTTSISKPGQDTLSVSQSITASTATVIRTETQGSLQTVTTTKYGRLASVVKKDYPSGAQLTATTYGYDSFYGRLASQTDARNGTTTYGYDAIGRIASVTTPDPDTSSNDAGRRPQTLTYIRTDLGAWAGYGWRETVSRVANSTTVEQTVSEYYPTGELRLSYGANTSPGLYVYDFAGRLKTLTTWRDFNLSTGAGTGTGDTTTWTYNDAGLLKTKRDAASKGADYTYYSSSRLKTRTWARLRSAGDIRLVTLYSYSATTGDLTGINYGDDTPNVSYSGHDRLGRPATITDGSGTRTLTYTTVYPLAEEYTAGALDNHKVTAARYASGRLDYLLTERDAASDYSVFYYWGAGNRLDSVFWWKAFEDPVDGEFYQEFTATYGYVANSDLVGQITDFFYENGNGGTPLTQTRTHDYLNRVTSIATTTDDGVNSPVTRSLAYAHNDRNQRTQVTNQSGSYWNYGYDSDSAARGVGQVSSAVRKVSGGTTAPGFEFGYAYDAMGNRTGATANGQTSTYYQDTGGSGSSGGNAVNQYGSRGVPRVLDIAGLADSSATVTVNSQSTQRQGEHWFKQLALSGNAAQWQSVAVSISTGGSTSGSVLLKEHPEIYAYDDDGNLTSDGRWTYVWDAENRLRRMETASSAYTAGAPRKRIDYAYDDRGRRTLKSVYTWNTSTSAFNTTPAAKVGFLYHDWNLLQEVNLSGSSPATLRSYYWGLDLSGTFQGAGGVGGLLAADLDAATYSTAFYASDANGNVSDLALCQGGFATHYEYDAFGNAYPENTGWINLASLNPFRFSTKYTETDAATGGNETGLLYYGFRYYNPSTGRWPNRDHLGEEGHELLAPSLQRSTHRFAELLPEGPNLYTFVRNNPVVLYDGDGRFAPVIIVGGVAIGALEAAAAAAGIGVAACALSPECRAAAAEIAGKAARKAYCNAIYAADIAACNLLCSKKDRALCYQKAIEDWGSCMAAGGY